MTVAQAGTRHRFPAIRATTIAIAAATAPTRSRKLMPIARTAATTPSSIIVAHVIDVLRRAWTRSPRWKASTTERAGKMARIRSGGTAKSVSVTLRPESSCSHPRRQGRERDDAEPRGCGYSKSPSKIPNGQEVLALLADQGNHDLEIGETQCAEDEG